MLRIGWWLFSTIVSFTYSYEDKAQTKTRNTRVCLAISNCWFTLCKTESSPTFTNAISSPRQSSRFSVLDDINTHFC